MSSKLKRSYKRQEGDMMNYMRKHNPRAFHKHFSKKKRKNVTSDISIDNFYDYFKNLISREDDNAPEFEHTVDHNTVFENLDKNITISEIESAIKKLKAGKSCAEDGLVNELFMKCSDVLLPLLYRLFNKILNCGHFPAAWATGCIIPIFKNGRFERSK